MHANLILLGDSTESAAGVRRPLEPARALQIVTCALEKVKRLHALGSLHGNLGINSIGVSNELDVELPDPLATVSLSRGLETVEYCPPELQGGRSWNVPGKIAEASQYFTDHGVAFNPRRIDVYQLGVLLCQMLTGSGCGHYLQSVNARGKVPTDLQAVIDSALGYGIKAPLQDASQLESALGRASSDFAAARWAEAPPTATAVGDTVNGASRDHGRNTQRSNIPSQLGRYRIMRQIGSGGMGDVYQAYEAALDRCVAIKILPPEFARQADFVKRFRDEALAIAKLSHPNIVQIFAFDEEQGQYYFAMQYVRGESLGELLRRKQRLPIKEMLQISADCLAALEAAHARGLIHRDVKPGNILLDFDLHRALLADFGLVKVADSNSSVTGSGMLLGTIDYTAPEQATGQSIDARADLYSLGVVMYQMVSGCVPFASSSAAGLIYKHVHELPRPLEEVVPDVPAPVANLIARLLNKNPAERFQTAQDVLAEIRSFAGTPAALSQPQQGNASADPAVHSANAPVQASPGTRAEIRAAAARPSFSIRGRRRTALIGAAVLGAFVAAGCLLIAKSSDQSTVSSSKLQLQSDLAGQLRPTVAKTFGEIRAFAGHRYQLVTAPDISWKDAQAACESVGGHLACPVSSEQEDFIATLKGSSAVWLGGYCDTADGGRIWKWLTGELIDARFKPDQEYADRLWVATTVSSKGLHVSQRAADGTFRDKEGKVIATRSTYVQGYVCQWDE